MPCGQGDTKEEGVGKELKTAEISDSVHGRKGKVGGGANNQGEWRAWGGVDTKRQHPA